MKQKNITIVTPVFNDWDCIEHLILDIGKALGDTVNSIQLLLINDCSTDVPPASFSAPQYIQVKRLNLDLNIGHQRAILIGLCYSLENDLNSDFFIVMDSDGEDNPMCIKEFLSKSESSKADKVVFAKRTKRSETWSFKLFYRFYKLIFKLLTGESISFGNFSCIPKSFLPKVCNDPNFWNHYSSAIIKSKIPFESIHTERSKRYVGKSKMNFNTLFIHGLSSLSVYIESIIIRILKLSVLILLALTICVFIVIYVKYFTLLAIPGWATYIFGFLFNILITVVLFNLLMILIHLNNRSKPITKPLSFYKTFIHN